MYREEQKPRPVAIDAADKPLAQESFRGFMVIDGKGAITQHKDDDSVFSVYVTGRARAKKKIADIGFVQICMKDFQDKILQYHNGHDKDGVNNANKASERLFGLISNIGQIVINFPDIMTISHTSNPDNRMISGGVLYPVVEPPEFKSDGTTYPLGLSESAKPVDFEYRRFNSSPTSALYIPQ